MNTENLNLISNNTVEQRIKEFKELHDKSDKEWFSELCFCLLTANSKAETALKIQAELGPEGFLNLPEEQIKDVIKKFGHRFHNNNFIATMPKTITPKFYLECENILKGFNIPLDKLDLIIWEKVTGKVLK